MPRRPQALDAEDRIQAALTAWRAGSLYRSPLSLRECLWSSSYYFLKTTPRQLYNVETINCG